MLDGAGGEVVREVGREAGREAAGGGTDLSKGQQRQQRAYAAATRASISKWQLKPAAVAAMVSCVCFTVVCHVV